MSAMNENTVTDGDAGRRMGLEQEVSRQRLHTERFEQALAYFDDERLWQPNHFFRAELAGVVPLNEKVLTRAQLDELRREALPEHRRTPCLPRQKP